MKPTSKKMIQRPRIRFFSDSNPTFKALEQYSVLRTTWLLRGRDNEEKIQPEIARSIPVWEVANISTLIRGLNFHKKYFCTSKLKYCFIHKSIIISGMKVVKYKAGDTSKWYIFYAAHVTIYTIRQWYKHILVKLILVIKFVT